MGRGKGLGFGIRAGGPNIEPDQRLAVRRWDQRTLEAYYRQDKRKVHPEPDDDEAGGLPPLPTLKANPAVLRQAALAELNDEGFSMTPMEEFGDFNDHQNYRLTWPRPHSFH